jgi:two-component system NtrC family sensor kinase
VATFVVLQGPDKGRSLKADDDVMLLGRSSDQVPLTDNTVSRRHAELRREGSKLVLYDLNSINGTYLNGVRLSKPTALKHGDQIRVGSTLMVYTGSESVEQLSGSNIPHDLISLDAGADSVDASIVSSVPSSDDSVVMAAPETASAVRAWRVIRELSAVIGTLLPPDKLLARVLDIIFDEVSVDRAIILMRDASTQELLPELIRFHHREVPPAQEEQIITSRTIINHVVDTKEGVLCSNVVADQRFRSGRSVQNLGMRSVICAPIVARDQVLGMIHLDSPVTNHTYSDDELRLITAIAYQTGLAIENAWLVQQHLEQERLAAAGETVAYLSHAIKNILQGMRSGGDLIQGGLGKGNFKTIAQGWGILDRNLDKCSQLMMNMLQFSKEREPSIEMVDINRVIREAVTELQSAADRKSIVLLSDLDDDLPPIPLDLDGCQQLLLNLISNAIDAVSANDGIINVRSRYEADPLQIVLVVADNGAGVPEDMRAKIFEPFHSSKGHGGTGLGLAVCKKFVEEMQGTITVENQADGGAVFTVTLPISNSAIGPDDTHGH